MARTGDCMVVVRDVECRMLSDLRALQVGTMFTRKGKV
jgi:hypothetical protein